ncbi:MAG: TetR/AcrR family transcriptional regulator [Acidobacteria bacterium]|nr:TetR/AcrR family transcriptional regulator [Acidobacteriota bacterium]
MGIAERRAREKTELRQEILDAARQIFVDEGFDALTMRKVAERIEYSPTTIYLHFQDKSELVRAICDEGFMELVRVLDELGARNLRPRESLEAGLRAYITFGLEHPSHYFVTFVASAGKVDYQFEGSIGERAFTTLRDAVAACMDAGDIRRADPEATAQALWAAVHGLVVLLITKKPFPFVERQALIDRLMETLMGGL